MYKVYATPDYQIAIDRSQGEYRDRVRKLPANLRRTPFQGKPLGSKYLREKRVKGRRIYYIVYEEFKIVLLVGVSSKKDQSSEIDKIKRELQNLYDYVKSIRQDG